MAELFGSEVKSTTSEGGIDELDRLPLTLRRKLLLNSGPGDPKPGIAANVSERRPHVDVVQKEDCHCNSPKGVLSFVSACSARSECQQLWKEQNVDLKDSNEVASQECRGILLASAIDQSSQNATCQKCKDMPGDCNCLGTQVNGLACSEQIRCNRVNADVSGQEKLNVNVGTPNKIQTLQVVPAEVKVEPFDSLMSSSGNGINGSAGADRSAVTVKKSEIPSDITDDGLDHIVLKERQKMLLSSSGELSKVLMQRCAEKGNEEANLGVGESPSGNQPCDDPERNPFVVCRTSVATSTEDVIAEFSVANQRSCESSQSADGIEIHASNSNLFENAVEPNSCEGHNCVPANTSSVQTSTLSTFAKVKVESKDDNNFLNLERNATSSFSLSKLRVKREFGVSDPVDENEIDHMRLQDRIKMPKMLQDSERNIAGESLCLKTVPSEVNCSFIASESVQTIHINHPRKRRKTATESVETALEEDAPGLLKVLMDKGVSVDEIKLYGEMESEEALDESSSEDSFAELEDAISRFSFRRESFFKFPSARCIKGARPSYCLACLLSLVEQTRYLKFRKWPVEWGWCRDLQSFIFVFKRHNRIVLERPEYGYATYFFEIVDSIPIDWQVKRLVAVMRLSSCGRVSLIDNKALVVGEDLTKGEAQVLMEYGWVPNSGLGTMLNFYDRVVHDRKSEKDISEWRSKIAKLLMDGFNGGVIVSTDIKTEEDYMDSGNSEIKLEF